MAAAAEDAETIARDNLPYIRSNYFNYSFKPETANVTTTTESGKSKLLITATLEQKERQYTVILKDGAKTTTERGAFQVNKTFSSNYEHPVWEMKNDDGNYIIVGTGATFTVKFATTGTDENSTVNDCIVIRVRNGNENEHAVTNKSIVEKSYNEVYFTDSGTEMVRHNFYIIDFCAKGKLLGGGVLFATAKDGKYRQQSAADILGETAETRGFIKGILGTNLEQSGVEYKAQTIDNIGFRYLPFEDDGTAFRYSDDYQAYTTVYSGTNVNNDANYGNQTLRLYSFMIYEDGGVKKIAISDGYAEVTRVEPHQVESGGEG